MSAPVACVGPGLLLARRRREAGAFSWVWVPQVTVFYLGLGSLVLVSRSLVAGGCSPPPARH